MPWLTLLYHTIIWRLTTLALFSVIDWENGKHYLKEWNMFQICSCHFICICFFRCDKHPNLDWSIWKIWNTIIHKISEAYLRTEAFHHIGFEAKQEMKPYYDIVHKPFRWQFWKSWKSLFQDGVTHISDNTEHKMY